MLRFFPLFTFIEHDYKGKAITCDKLSMQKKPGCHDNQDHSSNLI